MTRTTDNNYFDNLTRPKWSRWIAKDSGRKALLHIGHIGSSATFTNRLTEDRIEYRSTRPGMVVTVKRRAGVALGWLRSGTTLRTNA